jgi:WD40 repeat protein
MSGDDPQTGADQFVELVAACDEALAAGSGLAELSPEAPPELRARLERSVACMKLLRQALPHDPVTPPLPAVQPAPRLPHLGRFTLRRELGRGGFGVVWLAHDEQLDRDVALKVPRADVLEDPELRERFLREARAAAALDHPNVVPLYEAGEDGDACYLASAYCPGTTLAQWLKQRDAPVPVRDAAALTAALAGAVEHAHQRGVLHRDLKPANVLLEPCPTGADGLGFVPRVTDFGLAKLLAEREEAVRTQTGAIVGTPAYMAPEQAGGHSREVGPAADVYALGALLYEVLTGRPPFLGETVLEVLQQVRGREPVPPGQLRPGLPRDLETICLKCLQKEPPKRYTSAQALADDLGCFLDGRPIQARPVGSLERGWRWCRRNPWVAGLATAAAFLLVAGTVIASYFAFQADARARDAEASAAATRFQEGRANAKATEAQNNARLALERLHEAQRVAAHLALVQGLNLCEQGEGRARGLLWLAYGLELAVRAEDPELERAARTLVAGWGRESHWLRTTLPVRGTTGAFSPDGKAVLTGIGGRGPEEARLWETATGKPLGPPLQHPQSVLALAFGPDGKTALTGSSDGTARLWEAEAGRLIAPVLKHRASSPVRAVAISPDGKTALTGGDDATACLWEMSTGKRIGPPLLHRGRITGVDFSPDGRVAVTGSVDKTVRRWNAATGQPLGLPLLHRAEVASVACSPDGKTLLTTDNRGTARLWEATNGRPIGSPWQYDKVQAVAFSPDGKTVLTGSADQTARLWEAATGKPLGLPLRHQGEVHAVAFSPDGRSVLTGSLDKTARLWDTATGEPLGPPLQHPNPVSRAAFSPDGKTLLTCAGFRLAGPGFPRLWEVSMAKSSVARLALQGPAAAALFSPNGNILLTRGSAEDQTTPTRVWEVETGKAIGAPLRNDFSIDATAFSPDGTTVLMGSQKGARLWEAATGKPAGLPLPHPGAVTAVAFSSDGKAALTGAVDGNARLWQVATGKALGPPLQTGGWVTAVAFSPDAKNALTGSSDDLPLRVLEQAPIAGAKDTLEGSAEARLWNPVTGLPLGPPLPHRGRVSAMTFSPDGKTFLTGDREGTARLWDTVTSKLLGSPLRHQGEVHAVAFSPDGKIALTGSDDHTARLWDAVTGTPLGRPLQHQAPVKAVAFSPGSTVVLTGSDDGTARLWEAATGMPLGPPLRHQGPVRTVAFRPDGKTALTASEGGTVGRWPVPAPVPGKPERVSLWVQLITGMELDEKGAVGIVDAEAWQERRQRLQELGGPPLP